jgi:hypothetical protein
MQDASVTEIDRSTGTALLERGEWAGARDAFVASLEAEESPEAHDGVG